MRMSVDHNHIKERLYGVFLFAFLLALLIPLGQDALSAFHNFYKAKGDWDKIRSNYVFLAPALEAKKIIPPYSRLQVSPVSGGIERIGARYYFYPSKIDDKNWSYFIDFNRGVVDSSPQLKVASLSLDAKVYAKPGYGFVVNPAAPKYPIIQVLQVFFLVSLLNILLGSIILGGLLRVSRSEHGPGWYFSISYMLGFIFLTSVLWVFLLAGGMLERVVILFLWSISGIILLFISRRRSLPSRNHSFPASPVGASSLGTLEDRISWSLAIAVTVSIFFCIVLIPVINWDAMSHWLMKSKVFFYEQRLDLSFTYSNYYPVLWPLNIAAQFSLLGGDYDEVAQWTIGLFFLCFVVQMRCALSALKLPTQKIWLSLLLYLVVFYDKDLFTPAIPEGGFLAMLTAAMALALLYLKDTQKIQFLILSLVMMIGVSGMKMEGAFASIFLGTALLFVSRPWGGISNKRRAFFVMGCYFLTLFIPIAWSLWVKSHGFFHQFYHLSSEITLEKLRLLTHLAWQGFIHGKMPVISVFVVFYFIFFPNPREWSREEKFLLVTGVLLAFFSWASFLGWPIQGIRFNGAETSQRLFFHATPALALLLASRAFVRKTF